MTTTVLWFRRDLRLADHPALQAAASSGPVLGLFVLDPVLWRSAGPARRAWLAASLRALSVAMGDRLAVRYGAPARIVPAAAASVGARTVHLTGESTPYGVRRDRAVAEVLAGRGVTLCATGTPYAVEPGSVRNGSGAPYRVFTPFARAWSEHGWPEPLRAPTGVDWLPGEPDDRAEALLEEALREAPPSFPAAGEEAAHQRWRRFLDSGIRDYDSARDRPDLDSTSRLSPYLRLGVLHPRQLLADLRPLRSAGAGRYRTELAWREFYADVLWHRPETAWSDLRPVPGLTYDDPGEDALKAWMEGRTGYPLVDAGMRQLRHEGWMHNRVRMVTASFLTKDLHAWWPVGARHFLDHLVDGDLASNNHGWQWVAGTGTDAAPYFRVFNPVTQGLRFDPAGDYVRRWVPELGHLPGAAAHEPWRHQDGYARGYPARLVDHAAERKEALRRLG
jgi:deoxyribodipyrimidine photo-lyase